MTFLALDTGGEYAVLALVDETSGKVSAATVFEGRRALSRRLLGELDKLLTGEGLTPNDLSAIAVGIGPGSFTGVRVGVTTAKTLAQVLEIPLIGIGTLNAYAAVIDAHNTPIIPLLPSRRGECYAAFCQNGIVGQPEALSLTELAARIEGFDGEVIVCGATDLLPTGMEAVKIRLPWTPPDGLAKLASERMAAGRYDDPMGLTPLYLVPPHITTPKDSSILPPML